MSHVIGRRLTNANEANEDLRFLRILLSEESKHQSIKESKSRHLFPVLFSIVFRAAAAGRSGPGLIRAKAGARPMQSRCKAGRPAALQRVCTGITPGLVRAELEDRVGIQQVSHSASTIADKVCNSCR
jgi:hypothetical protein